ncbi:MAG: hypothetical protein WCC85_02090, partial [Candidatus Sulfotelmatobacter sp.]
ALFRKEQHFTSTVIDRGLASGSEVSQGILDRARERVEQLLAEYRRPEIPAEREQAMLNFAETEGGPVGLEGLPGIIAATSATR